MEKIEELQKDLLNAITTGNPVKLYGALRDGAKVHVSDSYGTPLQKACMQPNIAILKALLEAGANPNVGLKGQTAFHVLAQHLENGGTIPDNAYQIIYMFLEYRADPYLFNMAAQTVIDKASPSVKEILLKAYENWKKNGCRVIKLPINII
jgi:ankyrin repeat protein